MLSKEEIEKTKDFMIFYKNYCLNKETANIEHYETVNNEEFVYKNIEEMLEYIKHLESREQKLIKYCKSKSTFQTYGNEQLERVLELYVNRTKNEILEILKN